LGQGPPTRVFVEQHDGLAVHQEGGRSAQRKGDERHNGDNEIKRQEAECALAVEGGKPVNAAAIGGVEHAADQKSADEIEGKDCGPANDPAAADMKGDDADRQ
jgi:hypothetical protein